MKYLFPSLFITSICLSSHAQTWQQLTIPTTANIHSSSFITDDEGWIGTDNTSSSAVIYHTSDGGASWNPITIDGASGGSSYLTFVSPSEGYAIVNGIAFKTNDGGNGWNPLTLPGNPSPDYAPYFLSEDTGFILGFEILYKTTDGGNNWTSLPCGADFKNFHFLDESRGTATDENDWVYETTDGGQTWYIINDQNNYSFLSSCFNPGGAIFACGTSEDTFLSAYIWGGS
jgi:photosystem II stability/assembly factor-like uncharacterized protein